MSHLINRMKNGEKKEITGTAVQVEAILEFLQNFLGKVKTAIKITYNFPQKTGSGGED